MAKSTAEFISYVLGICDKLTLIIFEMIEMARDFFARECLDHPPDLLAVDFGVDRGGEVAERLTLFPTKCPPTPGLNELHSHFVIQVRVALIDSLGFVSFTHQCFALLIPPWFGRRSRESRCLRDVFS